MKKWYLLLIFLPLIPVFVQAAPYFRYEQTILPITDSKWELGTTTKAWLRVFSDEYCLTGDSCITAWPGGAAASFSTTSADYWVSTYDKGYFFSTTSADAWKSLRNFHSTTSVDYWETTKWRWSTTSSDYWETQQWRWATTSATYHLGTFDKGYFFSTTSAQYFVHSSTTIPKTYTANTWTLLQTFSSGFLSSASSTVNSTFVAATTTTGSLNGNVHVTGWPYAQTSAGLQQALNVCNSNGGGTVYAAPGSYTISSTVNLKSKCVLQGAGPSTVLVLNTGTTLKVPANTAEFGIRDLKVDPSALAAGNTYGIYMEDVSTGWIERVQIPNAPGFAFFFTATAAGTTSKLWVTDNYFTGLGTSDVIGCGPAYTNNISRVGDVFLERNYVAQDSSVGDNHGDSINCVAPFNIHFNNNIVYGGVLFGMEQQPHLNSSMIGNTISHAIGGRRAAVGFVIESGATTTGGTLAVNSNTINGGFLDFFSNPTSPIFDGLVATGNIINATGTATTSDEAGIRLANIKGANISNNSVPTSTSDCIWATGVASSTFMGNTCGTIAGQAFHEDSGSKNNQWLFNTVDYARYADALDGSGTFLMTTKSGNLGIGTSTPQTKVHLDGASPVFFMSDTGQTGQDGKFQIRSDSNLLQFFSGRLGSSANEKLRLGGNGINTVTSNALAIQTTSGGVFTGTTLINLPTSGNVYFNNGGNVGIGTTTPGATLSVVGNIIASTTATSTATNGWNLTGGCFAVGGTCITGGTTYAFTYPLVNTANTISLAFGTTTANTWSQLQTFTSGLIAQASSTIGDGTGAGGLTISGNATTTGKHWMETGVASTSFMIGTTSTTTSRRLTIVGSDNTDFSGLQVWNYNFNAPTLSAVEFRLGSLTGTAKVGGIAAGSSATDLGLYTSFNNGSATEVMRLKAVGDVGIGSTSPSTRLSVNGPAYITAGLGVGVVNTATGTLITTGNTLLAATSTATTPATFLDVAGDGATLQNASRIVQILRRPFHTGVSQGKGVAFAVGAADTTSSSYGRFDLMVNVTGLGSGSVLTTAFQTMLTVLGTQKVGIGTTTPHAAFSVVATGTTPTLIVASTSSVPWFLIDNIGRIGFASTTPSALWGVSIATTTQFMQAQLALGYASSTTSTSVEVVNWDKGNNQRYILNTNTTLVLNSTSSLPRDGARYVLKICQDPTGSRTLAWANNPTRIVWSMGTPTMPTTASNGLMVGLIYDARTSRYDAIAATSTGSASCVP